VPSVTNAPRLAPLPDGIEAGGSCTSEIATIGGVMVIVALALLVESATEVAVTVTVPPDGIAEGAT
jgi:hypothetical protein